VVNRFALCHIQHRIAFINQLIHLRIVNPHDGVWDYYSTEAKESGYNNPQVDKLINEGNAVARFALGHQRIEVHHLGFQQHANLLPVLFGDRDDDGVWDYYSTEAKESGYNNPQVDKLINEGNAVLDDRTP
jgi:ABC-type transport system substrate-binding protein